MRRHLPLASVGAVVLVAAVLGPKPAFGQGKADIQARAQVINAEASWRASHSAGELLEAAFSRVPPAGSAMDMLVKLKAIALHAPDGIGVFFDFESESASSERSAMPRLNPSAAFAESRMLSRDRTADAGSATHALTKKRRTAQPQRLVVTVHHIAN